MKNKATLQYSNFILIPLLCLGSIVFRFLALSQTPFANGWDSYFYLVQIKSWIETGQMHTSEHSIIYPYLILFYWLTSDYILCIKLGVSTLTGIYVWAIQDVAGIFFNKITLKHVGTGGSFNTRLVVAGFALFSPHLTYFAAQFPKNLMGMILLLAFIGCWHRRDLNPKGSMGHHVSLVMLLLANYFCHRFTFGLSLLYTLLAVAPTIWNRVGERHRKSLPELKKWMIPAAGIVLCLVLLSIQFFPGLAHWSDLGRLHGLLSTSPQFAPWSFLQSFGYQRIGSLWMIEIWFSVFLFLCTIVVMYKHSENKVLIPILCLLAFLLFPFTEWSLTGLSYRMLMVFVLLTNVLIVAFHAEKKVLNIFAALLVASAFISWRSYEPLLHDPNYLLYEKITNKTLTHFRAIGSEKPELVIMHNALAEYYTFTTAIDAMPWLPEYDIDPSKLWRIAADVNWTTLQYHMNDSTNTIGIYLGTNYGLIPEYAWQKALENARREGDSVFIRSATSWMNPYKMRPGWLLRRK